MQISVKLQLAHLDLEVGGDFIAELTLGGVDTGRFDGVDDDFALFGTVNLDNRSLHLNFEMMLLVFNPKFVADLVRLLRSYEARCSEVDPVTWHKRPLKDRLLEGICYLLSPLL